MGDSKHKTMNKLGRLFGKLSTNLVHISGDAKEHANSAPKPHSPLTNDDDFTLLQQENDQVSPLPPNRATSPRAAVPATAHVSLSPLQSSSSNENVLIHPQPQSLLAVHLQESQGSASNIRSPPVLRSSSLSGARRGVSTPESRPSSVKRTPSVAVKGTKEGTVSPVPHSQKDVSKPRFKMLDSGLHEHNLRSAKRQEKLSNMLKDLMGAKKLRDEAKSAVPNILQASGAAPATANGQMPPTLFAGLVSHVKNNTSPYHGQVAEADQQDCRSFVEKYGRCQEVIGRGAFGVVRVSHKKLDSANSADEVLYAVKEFKRRPNEAEKKYNRRLTSEFCILSSLKNINIIDTLDLLKDAKGDYCEVMEFCPGGDLYTLIIASGKLEYAEADCFFKQMIRGVNYMHDLGVAHRDLKPENLLLTQQGVLKITDFGNGECFKMAWEDEIHLSEGVSGSLPYIAPEEFTQKRFDPRCVDIWACGVIYMAMRTGRQLWKLADARKDEFFDEYISKRKDAKGYEPIELLKRARCRNVIYSILDPKPERRITGKQILSSEWGREIKVCDAGDGRVSEAVVAPPTPINGLADEVRRTSVSA